MVKQIIFLSLTIKNRNIIYKIEFSFISKKIRILYKEDIEEICLK